AAFEVALDSHPAHLATAEDVVVAYPRNIVLRVTRSDAGRAPGTPREVDRHAPLWVTDGILSQLPVREHRCPKAGDSHELAVGVGLRLRFLAEVVIGLLDG